MEERVMCVAGHLCALPRCLSSRTDEVNCNFGGTISSDKASKAPAPPFHHWSRATTARPGLDCREKVSCLFSEAMPIWRWRAWHHHAKTCAASIIQDDGR